MASMYLFARTASPHRFAMLSTTLIGLGTVGNLLGASPLAYAVAAFGWRGSMLMVSAFTAVSAALVGLLIRDPPQVEAGRLERSIFGGLGTILRLRELWPILPITAVSYAVVISSRSLWIAPFLGSVYGIDVTGRGNAAFVMGLAMSVGALAYGPIERALGAKRTTLYGVLGTGAAFLALGFWGDDSLALAVALLAAAGALGMSYAILMAHAREFMPTALLGRGVTFLNFVFIAGAGLVQWASGLFVQAAFTAGVPAALTFERLHLSFGILLAVAVAIYAFAPAKPAVGPARP